MEASSSEDATYVEEWEPDDGMKTGNDYRKLGGKMRAHKDHQNGGETLSSTEKHFLSSLKNAFG